MSKSRTKDIRIKLIISTMSLILLIIIIITGVLIRKRIDIYYDNLIKKG
ncbi:MAG: hypothetical protein ACOCV8_02265 [Spirochaetota bacterium]